jgi:hypothetical protein
MDILNVSKPTCPRCKKANLEVHETTVEHLPWDGVAVVENEVQVVLTSVVFCMSCEWAEELHLLHLEAA